MCKYPSFLSFGVEVLTACTACSRGLGTRRSCEHLRGREESFTGHRAQRMAEPVHERACSAGAAVAIRPLAEAAAAAGRHRRLYEAIVTEHASAPCAVL
jgi:hypothetical protein